MEPMPESPETLNPSLFDWMEKFAQEVVAEMASPPAKDSPIAARISELVGMACGTDRPVTLDTLFSYVAAARGLHDAAQKARETGNNPSWAGDLHDMAQLFLTYAVGDIEQMASLALEEQFGEPASTVH